MTDEQFPNHFPGWGLSSCPNPDRNPVCKWPRGAAPAVLQEIQLPVASRAVCTPALQRKDNHVNHGRTKFAEDSTVFCWGGKEGRSGCLGDSGSPLMAASTREDGSTKYLLAGCVSGGITGGCGQAGNFGLAYETAEYMKWYRDTAGDGGAGDKVEWCSK